MTMSLNSELALAAVRVRALVERLPESRRPDVAAVWAELMDEVDDTRSEGSAVLAVIEWRKRFEARIARARLPNPKCVSHLQRPKEKAMSDTNILICLADVVEVLKAGTDDPDDSEQITEDDRNFFNAARLFLAELRRQAQERGQGDWSTTHLLAAFEQSLTLDQDLDEDLRAACCVIREWLTLEQAAVASMN
jgi:hypothetical protein